jgi:membrane protease YdiL (CAAX protease family)
LLLSDDKRKTAVFVAFGFIFQVVSHEIGGYCLAPRLAEVFPKVPLLTLGMLSSSAISPLIAITYFFLISKFVPRIAIDKNVIFVSLSGIVLAYFVILGDILFIGRYIQLAQDIISVKGKWYYLTLFLLIVWGPLLEETLYRGYIFEILRKNWGNVLATLFSSILFVIFHGIWGELNFSLVFIFLYSILFTCIYIQGGLVSSVLVHSFVNSFLFYVNMSN